jgi:exportin-2 (importin alpha re-exporter)
MIELKHVLDAFAAPFTAIFVQCCQQIPQNLGNAGALVSLFSAIKTMLAIFYSLNCVDIPEYFEDNREPWFTNFHNLLSFQSQIPELVENPVRFLLGLLINIC